MKTILTAFIVVSLSAVIIAIVIEVIGEIFGKSPTEDDRCRGGHDF